VLSTVAGFYRYAQQDGLIDRAPAVHVRPPRLDYESHATGLDRNEVGALLVATGLGRPAEHALVTVASPGQLRPEGEPEGPRRGVERPTVGSASPVDERPTLSTKRTLFRPESGAAWDLRRQLASR